ncbi:amino acid deaminase/aldolase [Heyndrickxia sp. NPDC080065]|uniref:amino acid deaminase/aldolase n=1 Tax=Heyndrickxia sp. NPDC080065 TaxID=3390568 RepID=UPI003D0376DE
MSLYEQYEEVFIDIPRPFAFLDMDYLDLNISFVQKHLQQKKLRIATKSIRSIEVLKYIANHFQSFTGWMTFSAKETIFLLKNGFDHCLIGYPILEKDEVDQLVPYIREGKEVVWMVDSIETWKWLHQMGEQHDTFFSICLDINVSSSFPFLYFGTKRSPLVNEGAVVKLINEGMTYKKTKVVGLMGYEAQIAGVGDRPLEKWKRSLMPSLKKASAKDISKWRKKAVEITEQYFGNLEFVNGGGSGSLLWTAEQEEVTEITVGSAFFFPGLFDQHLSLPLQPAAGFGLRVTRKPERNIVVCHGGGYTASGSKSIDKFPVPYFPEGLSYLANEGPGEVQTPLKAKGSVPNIGATIYFRHAKAGELCERFQDLYACRGDKLEAKFRTYRGEGECFL